MSDAETTAETAAPEQQFGIQRLYVKDISFETPNSPAAFAASWEPAINLELNSNGSQLGDGLYEVVLTMTVTCKNGDKTVYLAEVQQAGIFTMSGFDEAQLGGMMGSYCPNILFPYAREVITDLVSRGSFPQLVLAPINFDALYAQHRAQQQDGEAPQEPTH